MNEKLAKFMLDLSSDFDRLDRFNRSDEALEAELAKSDLSESDKDALRSRDPKRIHAALDIQPGSSAVVFVIAWPSYFKSDK